MMTIGIDPGNRCGFAVYERGRLVHLSDSSSVSLLRKISTWIGIATVVIEDSRLQSKVWNADGKNRGTSLSIARKVGSVDRICMQVEEICKENGLELLRVSPLDKGSKVKAEAFKAMTGWDQKTNEHQRDAAMVAWPYRHKRATA